MTYWTVTNLPCLERLNNLIFLYSDKYFSANKRFFAFNLIYFQWNFSNLTVSRQIFWYQLFWQKHLWPTFNDFNHLVYTKKAKIWMSFKIIKKIPILFKIVPKKILWLAQGWIWEFLSKVPNIFILNIIFYHWDN